MKMWSYKTITERAENEIRSLMKQSADAKIGRIESDPDFEKRMYKHWAYGVFIGWKNLTMGWMKDDDYERLELLTEIKGASMPEKLTRSEEKP